MSVKTTKKAKDLTVQMLELSTAHISQETNSWMDMQHELSDLKLQSTSLVFYEKAQYGWFVVVPQDDIEETLEGVPADLKALVDYAVKHDIRWIMLDCDAETTGEFPTFDW